MTEFLVTADPSGTTGTLSWDSGLETISFKVSLGRSGTTPKTYEGDGATPLGCYPLRRVYYRPDRVSPPQTELEVRAIRPDDGWCDAPDDIFYNRPVRLPYEASHEVLWREDHLYDLIIVIGQNDDPVVPWDGSAIFMHVAREGYSPTEGCVGMAASDARRFIEAAKPGDKVRIVQG